MTAKLTVELRQAIEQSADALRLEDEQSSAVYFVVDENTHQRAMQALREKEDFEAIQAGIEDMEAGRVVPFEQIDARIRAELGLPSRS